MENLYPKHGLDLALYDNKSWNDPRDFAKPVKAIALPQDVPSTSDRRLIELENQVQRLMEAHLAPTQPTQVNKITTLCEICSGPHETQYCMEDPEQAFVEYASSRTDEAGEGLVSKFMASQDARLSRFEADFKQQQSEMTNKIDTVLKAITDRIVGTLPIDTVKNPKLSTYLVFSAHSYPTEDTQCSTQTYSSINAITIHTEQQSASYDDGEKENKEEEDYPENIHINPPTPPDLSITFITEKVLKFNSFFESLGLVPPSSNTKLICIKGEDGDVMFIEIVPKDDNSGKEEPESGEKEVEYFDVFPTRSELTYHKYLMCGPIPLIFLRNPIIIEGCPSNIKIPCNIGHVHEQKEITRSIFGVKGVDLGKEEAPYWTTLGKSNSYKPRPSSDGVGAQTPYYARKDFLDCHIPGEWEISRDAELNPFKDTLVFRRMVEFLGAIPINLKCNMWESEDLIKKPINWDKPPKNGDGAWHAKIRLIDPDGEEFTKTLQLIPTTRNLSERESPREIIDLDHFYDT
ncbi:hypothetical protein Tco_0309875 [Tanacetum coccineum]